MPVKTARFLLPLAALVAALLFAPAASAAPATTKLSLTGPDDGAAASGKATVTATLTAAGKPLAGKPVTLYTGVTQLAVGNTDAKGKVSYDVTITSTTQLQASFTPSAADAPSYAPAKSNMITVAPTVGIKISTFSYLHAGRRAVGIPHAVHG